MMWKVEEPSIHAAHAVSADKFCISMGVLDYDDQFSIVLVYDASNAQSWGRFNIPREIVSIAHYMDIASSVLQYAALSTEGDVYFLGDGIRNEKIPGAGLHNQTGENRGLMLSIENIDGTLFSCGQSSQIYKRANSKAWESISGLNINSSQGYGDPDFEKIRGISAKCMYVCGHASIEFKGYTKEQREELARTHRSGDMTKFAELQKKFRPAGKKMAGRGFHWDGSNWLPLNITSVTRLNDIYIEKEDSVWVIGSEGTIYHGNLERGFRDVSFHGDTESLHSITDFKGEKIVASSRGLYKFDGHILSRMKPLIKSGAPSPLKVQAIENVLWYFDYNRGVSRFDGENWEMISIPPELMQRDFKGLRRR